MQKTSSRWLADIKRGSLFVILAAFALALMPGKASAAVLMCNAAGRCQWSDHTCEYYRLFTTIGSWTCFSFGPYDALQVHREDDGSASATQAGKASPIASDQLQMSMTNLVDRLMKGAPKAEIDTLRKTFETAWNSDKGKRVSDQRLQQIATDMKVKVERRPAKSVR